MRRNQNGLQVRRGSLAGIRSLIFLSALLLGVAEFAPPAYGTVVRRMDIQGLVGRADQIVVGTVKSTKSSWTQDRRYIVTDTVLEVSRTIHGEASKQIVVRRLGGTVDGVGMRVAGVTLLAPGNQVLLFTNKRGGHRHVVGMRQGAWQLGKDAKGRQIVRRDLGHLALAEPSKPGSGLQLYSASESQPPQQLDAFVRRIKDAIAECKRDASRCR